MSLLELSTWSYAIRVVKTRLMWGGRFRDLGRRVTLGQCLLAPRPQSISIGAHTMIHHRWSLADLTEPGDEPAKIEVGAWCRIQHDFQINACDSVSIGDSCVIAPRVFITDSDHIVPADNSPLHESRGFNTKAVVIEESCWLGVGAVVLKGVRIGHHSIVGANAVVTRSIPPYSIATGSPAQVVGQVGSRAGSDNGG